MLKSTGAALTALFVAACQGPAFDAPPDSSAVGLSVSEPLAQPKEGLRRGVLLHSSTAAPRLDELGPSPLQLSIWSSASFEKRFAESYLAESDVEPKVSPDEYEFLSGVLEQMSNDDLPGAIAALEAETSASSTAVFDMYLGNMYFQSQELESAAQHFRGAVEKFPAFRRAWKNLGLVQIQRSEFAEAREALTRALEHGAVGADVYGLLAVANAGLEQPAAAETAYRLAILFDPENLEWQMGLARALFMQTRFADASVVLDGLLAVQPDRAELHLLQANAYIGAGRTMDAATNYELADRLGGATVEALGNLGDIYANEQLYDLAVGAYGRALERDPGGILSRTLRAARVMAANGALGPVKSLIGAVETEAGDSLDEAQRSELLKLRARIAVAEGDDTGQAAILEQIVELNPLDGEALILLGQSAARAGDVERAIFWYERAANLETFEAEAKRLHAQALVGEGRYTEALPLLRRSQQLDPRDSVRAYLDQIERLAKGR